MTIATEVKSYRDLVAWQKGVDLVCDVYDMTKLLPPDERFGLMSQMRRCAVSIPSNIAEGQARNSPRAFASHLNISLGSAADLETQLIVANEIGYLQKSELEKLTTELIEIIKMLNGLLKTQKQKMSAEDKD